MIKKEIEWCGDLHLELADIYMDADDNESGYDACQEMALNHFERDFDDAMSIIKEDREKKL